MFLFIDLTLAVLLLVLLPYFFVCLRRYLHARKYWKEVSCEETQREKEHHSHKLRVVSVILLVTVLVMAVLVSTSSNSVVFM